MICSSREMVTKVEKKGKEKDYGEQDIQDASCKGIFRRIGLNKQKSPHLNPVSESFHLKGTVDSILKKQKPCLAFLKSKAFVSGLNSR